MAGQGPPGVRQQLRRVLKKPPDIGRAAQKSSAQHQPQTALRVGAGIRQGQPSAPGAAHHPPGLQAQRSADALHIGNQMGGAVVQQRARGPAAPAAALVPQNDPGAAGIKKLAVPWHGSAARATMNEQHRQTGRVAALLEIHGVAVLLGQEAVRIRLNSGKQGVWRSGWHGAHAMPFSGNAAPQQSA